VLVAYGEVVIVEDKTSLRISRIPPTDRLEN
jgi:flagellar motor switch/type III secretory pathway protein FliN